MKPDFFPFRSLEDFVASVPLHVNGSFNDGWGAPVTMKGVEVDGAALFADIARFSERTSAFTPTETLAFVNTFFTWISAEALRAGRGIVDKYIGDEVMIVFAREFGSEDPFVDALRTARLISDGDVLGYGPRIGVAAGPMTVGYVGTPVRFNCSVFGHAVTLAQRCASVRCEFIGGAPIVFPAALWRDAFVLREVLPPRIDRFADGTQQEHAYGWELASEREVELKNLPPLKIRELRSNVLHIPSFELADHVRSAVAQLSASGAYRPRA